MTTTTTLASPTVSSDPDQVVRDLIAIREAGQTIPGPVLEAAAAQLGCSTGGLRRRISRTAPAAVPDHGAFEFTDEILDRLDRQHGGNLTALHAELLAAGHPYTPEAFPTFWRRHRDQVAAPDAKAARDRARERKRLETRIAELRAKLDEARSELSALDATTG